MRADGRSPDALRPVEIQMGFVQNPAGSALIRAGRTLVLCTVHVAEQVPAFLRGTGRGWVTAEYSLLPGSTDTRTEREATRGRPSGRTQEIQRLIGRSLRAVTDMEQLGERCLYVDCDVLQADGGTRTAAITGAYVALAAACNRLVERNYFKRSPLRDSVAGISVGVIGGDVLLDLSYEEDARAEVDMNIVQTGRGRLVEVQGTGESGTFDREELGQMLDLAEKGIVELTALQKLALEQ
ncbi:MAG: ribonuclease PH [Deltaproteobacteria bacterium]|nr:ribonuclease PH [Myxococcales bacterium]MCZ6571348.1 ribonuclease PH [Deltaproteobacteria bacterium]MCZ6712935.1 ribonuclease PH [Deltaproteobacteria bacterium]TDJ02302.1 MAG: ribonuclease PH [Deltaproteobacteria bacterium]TDJ08417.1 MAG: ribonuclease PH [Deltaproteobacteria bacterium]